LDDPGGDKLFSDFLLSEYNNISTAHFNMKNSISQFFRYYILIASVPITVSLVYLNKPSFNADLIPATNTLLAFVCFLITFVGFGLMMYVLSMNFTATLYAQQVNGIRYFFYECSDADRLILEKIRKLPVDVKEPQYSLNSSINWLLITFSAMNSFYLAIGFKFLIEATVNMLVLYWFSAMLLQLILCSLRFSLKAHKK
jgi:hypothetical protein